MIDRFTSLCRHRGPRAAVPLLALVLLAPAAAFAGDDTICYAVADNDGAGGADRLFTMNKTTGFTTLIGSTGTTTIEASAFRPATQILYAATNDRLGTLNLTTGAFTPVGANPFGTCRLPASQGGATLTVNDLDGLTFDPWTGLLWGTEREGGQDLLLQVNATTGLVVQNTFGAGVDCLRVSGPGVGDDIDDIAIDPKTGVMYAGNSGANPSQQLMTINRTTGTATLVGAFGVNDMEGMSFFNDGQLYGSTGNQTGSGTNNDSLWRIDKVNGPATRVAQFSSDTDYESIACLTADANRITGTVFVDPNTNGVYEPGPPQNEVGQPGVTVRLYRDTNGNGIVDAGDVLIQTAVTDAAGFYQFFLGADGPFAVDINTATLPIGSTMTTDNIEVANFVGFGLLDANNNFGFFGTSALALTKTSSSAFCAGSTIIYSLIPRSTGTLGQTNVQVSDAIPAGTTFVSASPPQSGGPSPLVWNLGSNVAGTPASNPGSALCPAPPLILTADADTYIRQDQATNNFGTSNRLHTRPQNAGDRRHAFVRFNLGALPAGSAVDSAVFTVEVSNNRSNQSVEVHRMTTAWTETGATWNTRNGTTAWAGGGAFSASDYTAAVLGTVNPATTGVKSVDITAAAQFWATNGAGSNQGVVMLATGTDTGNAQYYSREEGTASRRPMLLLNYRVPTTGGCSGNTVLEPIADTYVNQTAATTNNGGLTTLSTRPDSPNQRHSLLQFNLGAIPPGATINNGTFGINVSTSQANHTATVRRALTPWTELGATWNTRNGTTAWAGGGAFSSADYAATSLGTITPSSTGFRAVNVTSLVDGWINGGFANDGLVVLAGGAGNSLPVSYFSRETATAFDRPFLQVDWTLTPLTATTTALSAVGHLVSAGDPITVTMTLTATGPDTGVTPGALTVSGAGGAGATCGAPSPASQNIVAGTPITFTWNCTAVAGAGPGSVAFSAAAAGGALQFFSATSNRILVSPPLTFRVTIDNPVAAGRTDIANTATVSSTESNPGLGSVTDPIRFSTLGNLVWEDLDENGVQNGNEVGLAGVTVRIYQGATCTGTPVATRTTDANGVYAFNSASAVQYCVQVDESTVPANLTERTTPNPQTLTLAGCEDNAAVDFGFNDPVTVPVTLASFHATPGRGGIRFEWTTATEAGNAGFNLYAKTARGWRQVNRRLIPSKVFDSIEPQAYGFDAPGAAGSEFVLEDVDLHGRSTLSGPFAFDRPYGRRAAPGAAIDWGAIHRQRAAAAQELQAATASVTQGWSTATDFARSRPAGRLRLLVDRDGLYRVGYEALAAAGLDLAGVKDKDIALENRGRPVARRIVGGSKDFGPGSAIEFYGEALDTLYTGTNVYYLSAGGAKALEVATDRRRAPKKALPPASYLETVEVNRAREYSFAAPNGDPWYDAAILAYTRPVRHPFEIAVDALADDRGEAALEVTTWGMTSWPSSPDHHLAVALNGTDLEDIRFDGQETAELAIDLPPGLLAEGVNTVEVTLPGDTGAPWEIVAVDRFRLSYPRRFAARDGRLRFTAAGEAFRVGGLPSPAVVVYRVDDREVGLLEGVEVEPEGTGYRVTFPGTSKPALYLVSTEQALLTPRLEPAPPAVDLLDGRADYLIIAHPDFLAGLDPLVAAREADGLAVKVVDVRDVYEQFGHGIFDAAAIRAYVARAAAKLRTRYVLLVGGDTYDYRDDLGLGSISFIPSLYRATDPIVRFAPVDPLYADVDGDDVPDLAIGRLPVRTPAELDAAIGKTLDYAAQRDRRTAVFAADADDGGSESFSHLSDGFIARLPAAWSVERAYLDDLGLAGARQTLVGALDDGVALASFFGHSGPSVWTFAGLFSADDAAQLQNHRRPAVISQWGCWNTYYASPYADSLGHALMLSGDQGAAAVLGASTLTRTSSDRALGELFMPRMVTPGVTLGEALTAAKQRLAATDPGLLDVLLGWTLLGDPALVIEPGR